MFLINDTGLTVLFVSMIQILFGRWLLLGKRCPYILSGNLADFCFVYLAVLTRKSFLGAVVEGIMLAIWNGFTGWNLNLNKETAAAQGISQIL